MPRWLSFCGVSSHWWSLSRFSFQREIRCGLLSLLFLLFFLVGIILGRELRVKSNIHYTGIQFVQEKQNKFLFFPFIYQLKKSSLPNILWMWSLRFFILVSLWTHWFKLIWCISVHCSHSYWCSNHLILDPWEYLQVDSWVLLTRPKYI